MRGYLPLPILAVLFCLAQGALGESVVFESVLTSKHPKMVISSAASLLHADNLVVLGHRLSSSEIDKHTCLSSVFDFKSNHTYQCSTSIYNDKDIYEDMKLQKRAYNVSVVASRSKSYILLGLPELSLQKKTSSGVAYFYEIKNDPKELKFMRSFNVTPESNTNTGQYVAIGENYAAVYQKKKNDVYIHTFINTFGEWKYYDRLKLDLHNDDIILRITLDGFNLKIFVDSSEGDNYIHYIFQNGWKKQATLSPTDEIPNFSSSRGDSTLILSQKTGNLTYESVTLLPRGISNQNYIGLSYSYNVTHIYTFDSGVLEIFSGRVNERKNMYYTAEAFFETIEHSEFNAKTITDQFKVSHGSAACTAYLDYFKQHYFRVFASLGYVCSNHDNPLAKGITETYEALRKNDVLILSFHGESWKLPTDFASFHDQGKRVNGLMLGYIAIGMAGPIVVLSFFWAVLGFCVPSLRPKNRNRGVNTEQPGLIPPQA